MFVSLSDTHRPARAIIAGMPRGPARRTVEFAHAIAQDPRLIRAILEAVLATLPQVLDELEAAERQAAAPPVKRGGHRPPHR